MLQPVEQLLPTDLARGVPYKGMQVIFSMTIQNSFQIAQQWGISAFKFALHDISRASIAKRFSQLAWITQSWNRLAAHLSTSIPAGKNAASVLFYKSARQIQLRSSPRERWAWMVTGCAAISSYGLLWG